MKPQIVKAAAYALMALGALFGLYEVEHLVWPAAQHPAFVNAAGSDATAQAATDSFVVGGVKKFPTGRILVNDQPFPKQTRTVCWQPSVGQSVDEKALVGRTITVFVPLTQYQGKPEYSVDRPNQYAIK
jgi:hypothetical protein